MLPKINETLDFFFNFTQFLTHVFIISVKFTYKHLPDFYPKNPNYLCQFDNFPQHYRQNRSLLNHQTTFNVKYKNYADWYIDFVKRHRMNKFCSKSLERKRWLIESKFSLDTIIFKKVNPLKTVKWLNV